MILCGLCRGAQNLICFFRGKPEYWDCPACNHWGVRFSLEKSNGFVENPERKKHLA